MWPFAVTAALMAIAAITVSLIMAWRRIGRGRCSHFRAASKAATPIPANDDLVWTQLLTQDMIDDGWEIACTLRRYPPANPPGDKPQRPASRLVKPGDHDPQAERAASTQMPSR